MGAWGELESLPCQTGEVAQPFQGQALHPGRSGKVWALTVGFKAERHRLGAGNSSCQGGQGPDVVRYFPLSSQLPCEEEAWASPILQKNRPRFREAKSLVPSHSAATAEPGFSLGRDDTQDCAPEHNSVSKSSLHKQKV